MLTESLEKYDANPFRPIDPEEARQKSGSPRILSGIFDPNAATVQPAMLARGLRRVAIELGVRIYEKTPLTRLERSKPPVVHTPRGQVRAQKVVIAMNAWGARFPELKRMIVVMSSDMVATAPARQRLDATGFRDGVCVTDSRTVLNYWRNTPDGRIVFGKPLGQFAFASRIGSLYDKPCPAADAVAAELRSFYPQLADVPIVSSWTGSLDRAMKGLPDFGHLAATATSSSASVFPAMAWRPRCSPAGSSSRWWKRLTMNGPTAGWFRRVSWGLSAVNNYAIGILVLSLALAFTAWSAKREECEQRDVRFLWVACGVCMLAGMLLGALSVIAPSE